MPSGKIPAAILFLVRHAIRLVPANQNMDLFRYVERHYQLIDGQDPAVSETGCSMSLVKNAPFSLFERPRLPSLLWAQRSKIDGLATRRGASHRALAIASPARGRDCSANAAHHMRGQRESPGRSGGAAVTGIRSLKYAERRLWVNNNLVLCTRSPKAPMADNDQHSIDEESGLGSRSTNDQVTSSINGKEFVPFDPLTSHIDEEFAEFSMDGGRSSFYESQRTESKEAEDSLVQQHSVSMNWHNLCLSVRSPGGGCFNRSKEATVKPILKDITGYARPGQMLAIMGGSGAGKSTLLAMLGGRVPVGEYEISGDLRVNGHERDVNMFRRYTGFVEQDDRMFADLTVREQIEFSARCRLPASMPAEKKQRRVEQVITELGLAKAVDTKIGNAVQRGVSGGERKRVNIGIELVTNPPLLLLDEPTTGLDSFQAQAVMLTMLRLARRGRTIIATIHQPRSQIFQMFDYLLLLSEGHQIYFGPAKDMVPYFAALKYPCPSYFNPADFALDLMSLNARSKTLEKQTRARISYLANCFAEHVPELALPLDDPLGATGDLHTKVTRKGISLFSKEGEPNYAEPWPVQFALLVRRSFSLMIRERGTNFARLFQTIIFSVVLGLIWLNTGRNAADFSAVPGVLFFLLINQSFGASFGVVFLFPLERGIVLRERTSRFYRVSAYFLAKSVAELPRLVALALLFSCITYWMVGLQPHPSSFFIFVAIVLITTHTAESLTLMASTSAKSPQTAAAIAPVLIVLSLLFGGFFIGPNVIPVWLRWLRYISFIFYGFAAVMTNQFGYISSSSSQQNPLNIYHINSFGIGGNIGFLIMLDVAYRTVAYLFLLWNKPRFQKSI
jgi:ABC-type multidrug transport system ATPase subunit